MTVMEEELCITCKIGLNACGAKGIFKRITIRECSQYDPGPCEHPGCLRHVSHPCEGCGRTGGRRKKI